MSQVAQQTAFDPSQGPREFLVSVEVYVSTITTPTTSKSPTHRKKREKDAQSIKSPASEISHTKKVKSKSSRKALSRNPGTGTWRPASCKLQEEGDRCLLNIYLDGAMLYQAISVHLLYHTDIRPADTSLFFRKDCLGIHCTSSQRWSSSASAEPVYIQFVNTEAFNTWLTLLRSYAMPEAYGTWFFPETGGCYRMWRQVDLTIVQGRNLGTTLPLGEAATTTNANGNQPVSEPDVNDMDVSCEIYLNDTLCGRTTVKGGIGCPDWHEHFVFPDLPPFDNLDIIVWQESKLIKPAVLGTVRITLGNFRRGETVEGWFPILRSDPGSTGVQVGELRLKIRVDEEIILPYSAYSGLLDTLKSRNFLEWLIDCDHKLGLKTLSTHFMTIAVAQNVLIDHVFEFADREVDGTPSTHNTLFRGNTTLTKVVELFMLWYGKPFLEASVGSVLRRLCAEKVAIEVDPVRSGKPIKEIEKGVELLIYWCKEFWTQIYSVRNECPNEMRRVFQHIRKLVEKRYRTAESGQEKARNLPWQSVSAFCFLRFIVPAILHPHLFGLCPGMPSLPVQRSLTLIAKVMQSLANLNATVQKEEFMRGVKDFLQDSVQAMIDYILVVSTPDADSVLTGASTALHERFNREAIPLLPHVIDLPKHLSIISASIMRNSQNYQARLGPPDAADAHLQNLCGRCFEVEEEALKLVGDLANRAIEEGSGRRRRQRSKSSPQRAHTTTLSLPMQLGLGVPISPIPSIASAPETHGHSPYSHRRNRKKSAKPAAEETDAVSQFALTQESLYDPAFLPTTASSRRSSVRDFAMDSPQLLSSSTDEGPRSHQRAFPVQSRKLLRRSTSSDSIPSYRTPTVPLFAPSVMESADASEETTKGKRGILRGMNILARR